MNVAKHTEATIEHTQLAVVRDQSTPLGVDGRLRFKTKVNIGFEMDE